MLSNELRNFLEQAVAENDAKIQEHKDSEHQANIASLLAHLRKQNAFFRKVLKES